MIQVRPTRPEDLPELAKLFEQRFGHPGSAEEWWWKYRHLPGEARSWLAVGEGGRVLAHAGALRLPARLVVGREGAASGARTGIWQLTDWMGTVANGGLRPPLVVLGRRLLADLPAPGDAPWIFGFPSERHLRLGARTFGYRSLPAVQPLAGETAAAAGAGDREMPAAGALREVTDRCGDWAEAAWEACGVPGVRRSAAFLNWRYHARPARYYRVYRLAPGAGHSPEPPDPPVDGLAVFAFVGGLARGTELWLPGPAGRWKPALRAVARDLLAAGLERWELWPPPPSSGLSPILSELGLRARGEPVVMGCRGAGGATAGPSPADPSFYYAMGDYDLA